jgi:C-terminal processing protease CtpA/Prc
MKRLIFLPMLLFACAAAAAPPSASSSADAARAANDAARAADEAARAGAQAARAGSQAARAGAEAAREAADAQKLADLQAHMNDLAQRMAELSARIGDQANASALRYLADSKSGMLGIAVDPDDDGIHVQAVTPDGPAERAGLKAGDVITAINGKRLSSNDASLLTGLSDLPPGKPVRLTVLRDGKTLHVRATPERFQPGDWQATVRAAQRAARQATTQVRSPEFRERIQKQIDEAMKEASRATTAAMQAGNAGAWPVMAPWWGLNLAPLNPDLGRYFGTDRGALVLSRDAKRYPELQPGDVITRVGNRAVERPQDAMRAFREASTDQPVAVTVRRHDKTLKLVFKSPPRWLALPPPPPAPPAPPAPVSPKAPAAPPPPAVPPPPIPPTSARQAG